MPSKTLLSLLATVPLLSASVLLAAEPDWNAIDTETLQHFQALVRIDTANPPGVEAEAAAYLVRILEAAGLIRARH